MPVLVPLAWVMMAYPALAVGRRLAAACTPARGPGPPPWSGPGRSPPGTCSSTRRWSRPATGPGRPDPALPGVPGIPLTNFAGWLLVSLLVMAALDRAARPRRRPTRQPLPRLPVDLRLLGDGQRGLLRPARGRAGRRRGDGPGRGAAVPGAACSAAPSDRASAGAPVPARPRGRSAGERAPALALAAPPSPPTTCAGCARPARHPARRRSTRGPSPCCCRCATRPTGSGRACAPLLAAAEPGPAPRGSSCSTTARPTAPPSCWPRARGDQPRGRGARRATPLPARLARQAVGLPPARRRGAPGRRACWSSSTPTSCSPPHAVAATVAPAARRRARPRLPVPAPGRRGAAERLVQPLLQWSWLTTLPLGLAERSPAARRSPRPTVSCSPSTPRAYRAGRRPRGGARRGARRHRAAARGQARRRPRRGRRRHRARHLPDVRRLGRAARRATEVAVVGVRLAGGRPPAWSRCSPWPTSCPAVAALRGSRVGAARLPGRRRRPGAGRAADRRPVWPDALGAPGVGARCSAGSTADSLAAADGRGTLRWKGRPGRGRPARVSAGRRASGPGWAGSPSPARLAAAGPRGHRRASRPRRSAASSARSTRRLRLRHRARRC